MRIDTVLIVDMAPSADAYYYFFQTVTKETGRQFNIVNIISDEMNFSLYKNYIETLNDIHNIRYHDLSSLDYFNIRCIVNGSDIGYNTYNELMSKYFPDLLNDLLDVKTDKYNLYTYLKSKKLISTNQSIVNSSNYKNISFLNPSVMKPNNGVGGKDTFYINDIADLTILESLAGDFILQDRIFGDEYSVDFISANGEHKLNAVWKYTKPTYHHHREEIDLVNPYENKDLILKIYKYMTTIFLEIGHKNGPTHSELMVFGDQLNLIEINFRLHGHLGNLCQYLTLGTSHARETIMNYKNPKWQSNLDTYSYFQPLKKILLNNKREKYIESIDWESIETIKSVSAIYRHLNNPLLLSSTVELVPISTSVQTTLGFILISNKDLIQFEKDVATVRHIKNIICS